MPRADLTTALRQRLLADETLADLVGERVAPVLGGQGEGTPSLVYRTLRDAAERLLGGPSEMRRARVEYDCYAATFAGAMTLADHVERVLDGFSGRLPYDGDARAVVVYSIVADNNYDRGVTPREGSDEPDYRRLVDFQVAYRHEPAAVAA